MRKAFFKLTGLIIGIAMCLLLVPSDSYASTEYSDVEIGKRYDVTSINRDWMYGFCCQTYIPEDGKIRIWIEEYIHDGYEEIAIPDKGDSVSYRKWIRNVEDLNSGWITVNEGEFWFHLDDDLGECDGTLYIEFQASDKYVGEHELNDTCETANELEFGELYPGDFSGELEHDYLDHDFYKFTLEQPAKISINIINIWDAADNVNYKFYKKESNGNLEETYLLEGWQNAPDSLECLRLPEGNYYIDVMTSSSTPEYTIKVDIANEAAGNFEREYNNVSRNANDIISGTKYTGNLNTIEDIDWFKVSVPVKSTLEVSSWVPRNLGDSLVKISTYNKELKLLSEGNTSYYDPYMSLEPVMVPAGEYFIRVSGRYNGLPNTYDYQIRVNANCVNHMLETSVIKKADYGVKGKKEEHCTVCNYSKTIDIPALKMKPVTNLKANLRTGNKSITVSWTGSKAADAYNVYMKAGSGNYYKKACITGVKYTAKGLVQGKKYTFAIVPCIQKGNSYVEMSYAKKEVSSYTLAKVSNVTVSKSAANKVKVKWKNINGETGYQISKSNKKNGTSIVSTYKTTTGKYKVLKATKGKNFYYKVRAYKVVNGTKVFGPWSNVKSFKIK